MKLDLLTSGSPQISRKEFLSDMAEIFDRFQKDGIYGWSLSLNCLNGEAAATCGTWDPFSIEAALEKQQISFMQNHPRFEELVNFRQKEAIQIIATETLNSVLTIKDN